jgi:isopenicillin N synthase-like dioxygenase
VIESVDLRASAAEVAVAMSYALRERGAFYLTGHGLGPELFAGAYEASRQFHALDEHLKRKVAVGVNGLARGWHQGVRAGKGSYETYEIGLELPMKVGTDLAGVLHGPNVWPRLPGFREHTYRYFVSMLELARRLLRPLCVGLGLPPEYLADRAAEPCCLLRVLNYEPHVDDRVEQGITAHTDFEVVTIIAETSPGLELCDREGNWTLATRPGPNELLVVAGDMLEIITAGQVESPLHRVCIASEARQSLAFFFGLDADATISPQVTVPEGGQPLYGPTLVGHHLAAMQTLSYPQLRKRHSATWPTLSAKSSNPYKSYKLDRLLGPPAND